MLLQFDANNSVQLENYQQKNKYFIKTGLKKYENIMIIEQDHLVESLLKSF